MSAKFHWRFPLASGLLLGSLLSVHLLPALPVVSYTLVFIASSGLFLWVSAQLLSTRISGASVTVLLLASLAVRVSFLTNDPYASDDIYRYMWDGKVQSAGINPYRYAPDSPELEKLHSDSLPRLVNHPNMPTVYFPLSEWFFFVGYQLSGEMMWGYKLLNLLAEALTFLGLVVLTRHLRLPSQAVLLYALCPLPILQFAADAHIDAVGLPLFAFGLFAYLKRRTGTAALLLGLSMSIKPVALIILPALYLHERERIPRLTLLIIPPLVVLLQSIPYTLGANPFEALGTFTAHWKFNGIVFDTLNGILVHNQRTRIVCAFLLVVSLLFLYRREKRLLERLYYSVLLLLLFSPVVHPWYVSWLALILPLVPRWSGILLVGTVSLTAITAMRYRLTGEWNQDIVVLCIEYLPVIVLLVREIWKGSRSSWDMPVHAATKSVRNG